MILFSDTVQERCDVQHDAAAKAQGGYNFHSAAQLIRRRDIAVAKWSNATARLRVFTAFYRQWTIRRRDIAWYSGGTTASSVRKF